MGLFDVLIDVVLMPVRIAVDIVKSPVKIVNGEDDLLENTAKGIDKIEDDLAD